MTQNVNTALPALKNQSSAFRSWVHNIWLDNREERLTYGQDPATMNEYWNKYKYWLKREYKHQLKAHNE